MESIQFHVQTLNIHIKYLNIHIHTAESTNYLIVLKTLPTNCTVLYVHYCKIQLTYLGLIEFFLKVRDRGGE